MSIEVPAPPIDLEGTKKPEMIQFSIGCFQFGIKKKPPYKFDVTEYVKEVESFLKSISNISDIVISFDQHFAKPLEVTTEHLPVQVETFPLVLSLSITFEIYIPIRIQETIVEDIHFIKKPSTERFRVSVKHSFFNPVTFVEPIAALEDDDPASAIVIVREFIRKESKKIQSNYIDFQVLGPSPFHAYCYINKPEDIDRDDAQWFFWSEFFDSAGYPTVDFFYDVDVFNDIHKAKAYIFDEIEDEIGFYYSIIQNNNKRSVEWENISERVNEIIKTQKMKGIKGITKRYLSSYLLRDIFISIAQFESNDIFESKSIQDQYTSIYEHEKPGVAFKDVLDKTIKLRASYPTKQLIDLINLFENRREKSIESIVVIVSAVIGGICGAVFTILLSGFHW